MLPDVIYILGIPEILPGEIFWWEQIRRKKSWFVHKLQLVIYIENTHRWGFYAGMKSHHILKIIICLALIFKFAFLQYGKSMSLPKLVWNQIFDAKFFKQFFILLRMRNKSVKCIWLNVYK